MEQELPKHDCRNFVKKVFLVLDGELPEADTRLFINDIERCKACLEHYQIEKAFKEFITRKIERRNCTDSLKQNILSQIRNIDHASPE